MATLQQKRGDSPTEIWDQQRFGKFLVKHKGRKSFTFAEIGTDPEIAAANIWRTIGDYKIYNSDYGVVSIDKDNTVINGAISFDDIVIGYNNLDLGDGNAHAGLAIRKVDNGVVYAFRNGRNQVAVNHLHAHPLSEEEVYNILETRKDEWGASVIALIQSAEQYFLTDESHRVNELRSAD
ncbi:MAG: hypothetical protein IJJ25_00275 [Lachnospiraceae bacterium]|nr:hypothetical protein [Lachnospiraceae bacterium]MBQ6482753.1 hypothetical protein [Anaerolineaceae bacterium]